MYTTLILATSLKSWRVCNRLADKSTCISGGGGRVANYLPSRDVRFFEAWEKGGGKDSFLAGSRKEGEGGGKVE